MWPQSSRGCREIGGDATGVVTPGWNDVSVALSPCQRDARGGHPGASGSEAMSRRAETCVLVPALLAGHPTSESPWDAPLAS